jgi:hypothetical protein
MADLDPVAFDWSLKTNYSPDDVKSMCLEDHPLLAKMSRSEKFRGKSFVFGVKYARTRGRSAGFAQAQAYKGPSKGKDFTLTRKKDYSLATLDNELLMACDGDEAALVDAMTDEMDAAIGALKRAMGWKVFGDGSGSLGTGTNSSTTVTVSDLDTIAKIEDGMLLVFSSGITASLFSSTPVEASTIDRDAGTFVVSSDPGLTGTFHIFPYGDYVSASDKLNVSGVASWIPATAPTAGDSQYGVDRSVDTQRLAGVRINCNGLPLVEALIRGATRTQKWGGRPRFAVCSPENLEKVCISLEGKVIYDSFTYGDIGFEGVRIRTGNGVITLYADIDCPADKCYLLDMRSWKFKSAGGAPMMLKYMGQQYFHEATADGVEVRIGYYGNVFCDAPGWNAVLYNFG